VDPYDPGKDYGQSSILGLYERGLVDGARPGFLTRFAYRPATVGGELPNTGVEIQFTDLLAGSFALGGRIRVAKKLALTLEGEIGGSLFTLLSIDGYDAYAEVARQQDPDGYVAGYGSSSNDAAVGLLSFWAGPAASLEYGISSGLGVYVRPSFAWVVGVPILQGGTSTSTTTEPDGFLNEDAYTGSSFSLQVGLLSFGLTRHFDFGIGFRTATYEIASFEGLDVSGFFLNVGTTN